MDEIYYSVSYLGRFQFRTTVFTDEQAARVARLALLRMTESDSGYVVEESRRPSEWTTEEANWLPKDDDSGRR